MYSYTRNALRMQITPVFIANLLYFDAICDGILHRQLIVMHSSTQEKLHYK